MTQLLQALVNGLALAAVYALIALGFVIIYKSMQVLSFAQPGLLLLGAYWVTYFATTWGIPFWVSVLIAAVLAAALGVVIERGFLRPMVGKPIFAVAIMTIGIDLVIRIVTLDLIGVDVLPTGAPWGLGVVEIGGVGIAHRQIAAVLMAVALVGVLLAFFKFSRFGLAMRATAFDQEVALSQGVNVSAVFATSWAIGAVLAMAAGIFLGPGGAFDRSMAVTALKALPVIVVGGLDSIAGAMVGALIIAMAEMLTATYQPQYADFLGENFSQVVPYLVMFVVLLVKPYGLFGTKEVERV
jgi:branched-chain amino acid transport system permease protein